MRLVKSHMNHKQHSTNGLNLLQKTEGFSQAQSAWRFYNNEHVDIESLNEPMLTRGIKTINKSSDEYILVAHDWSLINYKNHTAKTDCIRKRRSNVNNASSRGYELQSSLAIESSSGKPILPLVQNLKTQDKVLSSYNPTMKSHLTHLGELTQRIAYINQSLNIQKKIVHVIDREADSAGFFRGLQKEDLYIVRALDNVKVRYEDEDITQKELSKKMDKGKYVKTIQYQNKKVKIYVNTVDILITRDSYQKTDTPQGKTIKQKVKGKPIKNRFIVQRLIDEKNNTVATWLLLSNLPKDVDITRIGLWYYYRWNIETYFKLLKSSGFNLEKWQQESAQAIFKRLFVASYACLLVWEIEHTNSKNMLAIRKFLVRLSGRLVARKKISTSPALLAGLWNFFSAMDMLELYDIEELHSIKKELNDFMQMEF